MQTLSAGGLLGCSCSFCGSRHMSGTHGLSVLQVIHYVFFIFISSRLKKVCGVILHMHTHTHKGPTDLYQIVSVCPVLTSPTLNLLAAFKSGPGRFTLLLFLSLLSSFSSSIDQPDNPINFLLFVISQLICVRLCGRRPWGNKSTNGTEERNCIMCAVQM